MKTSSFLFSVVGHVLGRGGELCVGLDDLVDGVEEVLLGGDLPPGADGEHAGLRADGPDLRARRVRAEPGQELVPTGRKRAYHITKILYQSRPL